MAAPAMFLSIIALVMVSVTSLVIVENRSRLTNLKKRVEDTQESEYSNQQKNNYKLDSVVKEINKNNNSLNDKLYKIETEIAQSSQNAEAGLSNADVRIQAGNQVNMMNYIAMSNVFDKRMADMKVEIDEANVRSRNNSTTSATNARQITSNSVDIRTQGDDLTGMILQEKNAINTRMSVFSNDVAPRVANLEQSDSSMHSWKDRHQEEFERQIGSINEEIKKNQTRITDIYVDALSLENDAAQNLAKAVRAQQEAYESRANAYFEGGTRPGMYGTNAYPTFDAYARNVYFNGPREIKDLQEMVDAVERNQGSIAQLGQENAANMDNIVQMGYSIENTKSDINGRLEAIQLDIGENARDQSSFKAMVENTYATIDDHVNTKAGVVANTEDITFQRRRIDTMSNQVYDTIPSLITGAHDRALSNYSELGKLELRLNSLEGITDPDKGLEASLAENAFEIMMDRGEPQMRVWAENEAQKHFDANIATRVEGIVDHRMSAQSEGGGVVTATSFPTYATTYMDGMGIASNAYGAVTMSRPLRSSEAIYGDMVQSEGDVLSGGSNSLNEVAGQMSGFEDRIGFNQGKLDGMFDVDMGSVAVKRYNPMTSGGSAAWIDPIQRIKVRHDMTMAPGTNLTMNADGHEGGQIFVPNFHKVKTYKADGTEVSLQSLLDSASAGGLDADAIASELNGARIAHLKTGEVSGPGECDGANTSKKCSSIHSRLHELETAATTMDKIILDMGQEKKFDPDNLKTSMLNADAAGQKMVFNSTGLALDSDVNFQRGMEVNGGSGDKVDINIPFTVNAKADFGEPATFYKAATFAADVNLQTGAGTLNLSDTLADHDTQLRALNSVVSEATPAVTAIEKEGSSLRVSKVTGPDENVQLVEPSGYSLARRTVVQAGDVNNLEHQVLKFNHQNNSAGIAFDSATSMDVKISTKPLVAASRDGDVLKFVQFDPENASGSTFNVDLSTEDAKESLYRDGTMMDGGDQGNIFIMGGTALMQGAASGSLKVCKYTPGASGGTGSVTACTPLWDHRQAPMPTNTQGGGSPPAA